MFFSKGGALSVSLAFVGGHGWMDFFSRKGVGQPTELSLIVVEMLFWG